MSSSGFSSLLSSVVALNNRGVDLFTKHQELKKASECFRSALKMLDQSRRSHKKKKNRIASEKKMVHRTVVAAPVKEGATQALGQQGAISAAVRQVTKKATTRTPASCETSLASRLDEARYYISSRPVKMSAKSLEDKDNSNVTTRNRSNKAMSAIAFNLALVHHLLGFTADPGKAQKYWRSAISFYEISTELRYKGRAKEEIQTPSPLGLMDIMQVNNAAVLYLQLGDTGRSNQWFRQMSCLLRQLDLHLVHQHCTGVVSNLILVKVNRDSNSLAAAA